MQVRFCHPSKFCPVGIDGGRIFGRLRWLTKATAHHLPSYRLAESQKTVSIYLSLHLFDRSQPSTAVAGGGACVTVRAIQPPINAPMMMIFIAPYHRSAYYYWCPLSSDNYELHLYGQWFIDSIRFGSIRFGREINWRNMDDDDLPGWSCPPERASLLLRLARRAWPAWYGWWRAAPRTPFGTRTPRTPPNSPSIRLSAPTPLRSAPWKAVYVYAKAID